MTPNAARLKTLCENQANLPVLFVSDPVDGDQFIFGTNEELENELEAIEEEGGEALAMLVGTHDLHIDYEVYEGDQPTIKL